MFTKETAKPGTTKRIKKKTLPAERVFFEGETQPLYIIGIDPDVTDNGICVFKTNLRKWIRLDTMSFFEVITFLSTFQEPEYLLVVIDAGWLNGTALFGKKFIYGQLQALKVAQDTGANHQIGKLFAEFCRVNKINYVLTKPEPKKNPKWDEAKFRRLTKLQNGYNQDIRDAVKTMFDLVEVVDFVQHFKTLKAK